MQTLKVVVPWGPNLIRLLPLPVPHLAPQLVCLSCELGCVSKKEKATKGHKKMKGFSANSVPAFMMGWPWASPLGQHLLLVPHVHGAMCPWDISIGNMWTHCFWTAEGPCSYVLEIPISS